MSFVSYAQNFEDVMLWRALKHVDNGFYIDVGANDPAVDSVTKAFYERGWRGINIEPLPSHHASLAQERPQDINLQCAAGAANGEIEVWECDVRGWATASADVVAQHTANGHAGAFHRVPVFQLADICAQHVSGEIHFLKIDVEGFEKSVIDGMDFSRFRPWMLVIEATRPNSTEEIHDEWEAGVLAAGYVLAYSDGLNRFYVADEHSELLDLLRYPPNVFDGFTRSEQLNSELRAQQAEAKAEQAEAKAEQATTYSQALLTSTSWRLTAPLRFVSHAGGRLLSAILARRLVSGLKRRSRAQVFRVARWVLSRPRLKKGAFFVLNRLPRLRQQLRRMFFEVPVTLPGKSTVANLSPRAASIHADLMMAIKSRKS